MSEPHECPLSEVIVGVDGDPTWTTAAPYPRPSCNGSGGQGKIRKPPHIKEGQMSEKKGPFDAAIKILRDSTIRLRAFNIEPNDINFAIRVLIAAGKVDGKQLCEYQRGIVNTLNTIRVSAGGIPLGKNSADMQILALLESLPDGGKK